MLNLDCRFDQGAKRFHFTLKNTAPTAIEIDTLSFSMMARLSHDAALEGAVMAGRIGNLHQVIGGPKRLAHGEEWTFSSSDIEVQPKHRLDGPKSAYLSDRDGKHHPVIVTDLPPPTGDGAPLRETPTAETDALAQRLFQDARSFIDATADRALRLTYRADLPQEAYRLRFEASEITVEASTRDGQRYGLIALWQILYAAAAQPATFAVPLDGTIEDAPRFGWRGCHLDVSRHFRGPAQISRLLDIMAWFKLNRFHWHLTDDEGWRIEIPDLPDLTRIGAWRGPDLALKPQHGYGAEVHGGFYTTQQIDVLVAHAASLGIEVMPEIDMPGHANAAIAAYPELRDPEQPLSSYRTVQGYDANTLNPGLPETKDFLEKVLGEVATRFPFEIIHLGGDEVAAGCWAHSSAALRYAERVGLGGTETIQSHFMRGAQRMLAGLGKRLGGWDEVANGGGVERDALLVGWQSQARVNALLADGYDVIASPGEAYYLDMVQAEGWNEPGTSWAGPVPCEASYAYDPLNGVTASSDNLLGVQACIWTEHLAQDDLFNHMVFPRLAAIAEAAWTRGEDKEWDRFAARCALLPML